MKINCSSNISLTLLNKLFVLLFFTHILLTLFSHIENVFAFHWLIE